MLLKTKEWSELVHRMNAPTPRYTSYPTAAEFGPLDMKEVLERYQMLKESHNPLSIYLHVPFCKSMCLFCGCSVILNRNPDRQQEYVDYLLKEIDLQASLCGNRLAPQIHFGGGTPTNLTKTQLSQIMNSLRSHFIIEDESAEISIEVDPRTVFNDETDQLSFLKEIGFNRVSFGVQDLNQEVQEAVKRRQSEEMTRKTYFLAKEIGFKGINIDLIYGLPKQTFETFSRTALTIASYRPDRIALFSYAHIPHVKAHQKAIPISDLPSTEEKVELYLAAQEIFLQAGYRQLGMDHFALPTDPLSIGMQEGTLGRNFQGYAIKPCSDMLPLGVTSIGFIQGAYIQNEKELGTYYSALKAGSLPLLRGYILNPEDEKRHFVIFSLMCRFELKAKTFQEKFKEDFWNFFPKEIQELQKEEWQSLITIDSEGIRVKDVGKIFIRNIAALFDGYNGRRSHVPFSRAI